MLAWLNELVKGDYSRVEQCANGAAYCQIMDALYQVTIFSSLIGARASYYLIMDEHVQGMVTFAPADVHQNRSEQMVVPHKVFQDYSFIHVQLDESSPMF